MACALENYYSAVSWEPLVGSALLSSLHTQISAGTSSIPYTSSTATDVWDALEILDSDPDVPGNIIEIYSQRSVLATDHVDLSKMKCDVDYNMGLKTMTGERSLFRKRFKLNRRVEEVILGCYVDDRLIATSPMEAREWFLKRLSHRFPVNPK